jgi:hypothetical protein
MLREILCGLKINDKDIERLEKVGEGGFGEIFILDENFVLKRILKRSMGDKNLDNRTLS